MKAAESMFVKEKRKVQAKEMFQKVKVKETESLQIHHSTEKWGKPVKNGGPVSPRGSLFQYRL